MHRSIFHYSKIEKNGTNGRCVIIIIRKTEEMFQLLSVHNITELLFHIILVSGIRLVGKGIPYQRTILSYIISVFHFQSKLQ